MVLELVMETSRWRTTGVSASVAFPQRQENVNFVKGANSNTQYVAFPNLGRSGDVFFIGYNQLKGGQCYEDRKCSN